jgi:hypothetical protein
VQQNNRNQERNSLLPQQARGFYIRHRRVFEWRAAPCALRSVDPSQREADFGVTSVNYDFCRVASAGGAAGTIPGTRLYTRSPIPPSSKRALTRGFYALWVDGLLPARCRTDGETPALALKRCIRYSTPLRSSRCEYFRQALWAVRQSSRLASSFESIPSSSGVDVCHSFVG